MAQIINSRTCFYTKRKYHPNQMLRFIIEHEQIYFDKPYGRGYYLKIDKDTNLDNIAKKIANHFHLKDLESIIVTLKQVTRLS